MARGARRLNVRIGLDLGGTKISALALDGAGRELARARVATPPDYDGIIKLCAALVGGLEKETGQKGSVGVGSPGAVDGKAGIIRFSPNIAALAGKPFAVDLSAALQTPVRLANDAQCFALSEAMDGAAAVDATVYGVILGTGVGGSLVVNKAIPHAAHQIREWGHVPLPWPDITDHPERCGCGRLGCIESYLSGSGLHRQLQARLGHACDNAALVEGLRKADPIITAVMDVYLTRLAKALAVLIIIIDPDSIVLGGGVSNLGILYDELPRRLPRYTVVGEVKTKILKAQFGDDSGLRGAAWLWPEHQEGG